ncbi:MAG: hypothetical protein J5606_02325, partial [Bacteroidales bacterium]|nr:hypothetical protein [Bacteroidales bacterium]
YNCGVAYIDNGKNNFFVYLHKKKDKDALRYWTINKTFSERMGDSWYYPKPSEKAEMARWVKELETMNEKSTSQLKERYTYMYMRILFYLKQYDVCQKVLENYTAEWTDKEIEKKCHLYYAGALFYTGKKIRAADVYADYEDWESLRFFNFKKNVDFMYKLYSANPNSKAFMFFVQNYLNKYQDEKETIDCKDFVALCKKVLAEKKTDNPALWQSALAHISFLNGDIAKAIEQIEKAPDMQGLEMAKDNARMLRLLYNATETDAIDYADRLNRDLPWLLKRVYNIDDFFANNGRGNEHSLDMLGRVILRNAFPHYVGAEKPCMAAALLNAFDEVCCDFKEARAHTRKYTNIIGSWDYSTMFFRYLDTTSIENVKAFLAFVKSGGKNNLEKSLIRIGYVSESMMNELIATKYIRVYEYDSAIVYLGKVMPSFYKKQNITDYLKRNPFMEKWIFADNERGSIYKQYHPAKLYSAVPTKLQFCRIMRDLEQKQKTANNEERAIMKYAYAVGLVSATNRCWALTQYAHLSFEWDGFYHAINNLEDLQYHDNGWDYRTSNSYMLQYRYQNIYSHIDEAESLTQNSELLARCQYLRAEIEMDNTYAYLYYRSLNNKFINTKFVDNERHHCDRLSDYR